MLVGRYCANNYLSDYEFTDYPLHYHPFISPIRCSHFQKTLL